MFLRPRWRRLGNLIEVLLRYGLSSLLAATLNIIWLLNQSSWPLHSLPAVIIICILLLINFWFGDIVHLLLIHSGREIERLVWEISLIAWFKVEVTLEAHDVVRISIQGRCKLFGPRVDWRAVSLGACFGAGQDFLYFSIFVCREFKVTNLDIVITWFRCWSGICTESRCEFILCRLFLLRSLLFMLRQWSRAAVVNWWVLHC